MNNQIKRIPYMGSKSKITHWVMDNITSNLVPGKQYAFLDVFGGGGSITTTVIEYYNQHFSEVQYNELNSSVYSLFTLLTKETEEVKNDFFYKTTQWVSRERFHEEKNQFNAWGGFLQTCWSFGHNPKSYLFGAKNEGFKKKGHDIVVNKNIGLAEELNISLPENFTMINDLSTRRLIFYKSVKQAINSLVEENAQHLQRLEHLERLERLQQLQHLQHERLLTTNQSFEKLNPTQKTVVYCDAPYSNTAEYKQNNFPHEQYKQWLQNLTKQNIPVFVSEYNLEIPGYTLIAEIEKVSLLKANFRTRKSERLYWNGK